MCLITGSWTDNCITTIGACKNTKGCDTGLRTTMYKVRGNQINNEHTNRIDH